MKARTFYGRPPVRDAVFVARCKALVILRCDLCGSTIEVRHVADVRWRARDGGRAESAYACASCRARLTTSREGEHVMEIEK